MGLIIHPHNRFSHGARELKRAIRKLGVKVWLSHQGNTPNENDVILNWGDSTAAFLMGHRKIINRPDQVRLCTNKLRFFQHCVNGVVPWTTDKKEAEKWQQGYARLRLEGSAGEGIVCWNKKDKDDNHEVPDARLYTRRVHPLREYRLHVVQDLMGNFKVLDAQCKVFQKTKDEPAPKSWAVRSHDNGFVFVRNLPPSNEVCEEVLKFVDKNLPELDFGAVDVIVGKDGRVFVLEINTAPGMEGETINHYAEYFKMRYDSLQPIRTTKYRL